MAQNTPKVTIISEAFANRFGAGEDLMGKRAVHRGRVAYGSRRGEQHPTIGTG